MTTKDTVYPEPLIRQRLKSALPHWYLDQGCIARRYRTGGWKGTLMVINAVGHLAEAAWHHPDIEASYADIVVKLTSHSAGGITDKDFELAVKIEEMVQWRPAADSALEGTPADEQLRYVEYD
jgi:pterin-4a-carbinolamine dehydratase